MESEAIWQMVIEKLERIPQREKEKNEVQKWPGAVLEDQLSQSAYLLGPR